MLLVSFGTRPEYIKIKPMLDALKGVVDYRLLFTGQHEDLLKHVQGDNIERLSISASKNRLDAIVSSVLSNERAPSFEGVTHVLIQGDTTSAFAVALSAFHRRKRVIHLEAGLRTYDLANPYPEEFNRQAIARLANINLCPTEESAKYLRSERAPGDIYVVGNTVLDNLVDITPTQEDRIVVTMHRRENHHLIPEWFAALDELAAENPGLEFILPIHPNPNVYKHREMLQHVKVVNPMDYKDFVRLLATSRFVITDSGGLQEESSFFRKKCVVCRKTTERTEGMGVFSTLCEFPEDLKVAFAWANDSPEPDSLEECPYGDGKASERIVKILRDDMSQTT
jgi:UDP-N-acetylglucosamine 2-epimerase (non-hydrolysing)